MNYLFIDIDGVLCTTRACVALDPERLLFRRFDPVVVALINKLCAEHEVRLISVSTWNTKGTDFVKNHFVEEGIKEEYIYEDFLLGNGSSNRALLIDNYIHNLEGPRLLGTFAVLDDDDCGYSDSWMAEYWVQPDTYDGLSYKNYRQLFNIFSGDYKDMGSSLL
tara:strand:+ start:2443 stop:2934 length:492 start_codon:yes stop_codon:yes gene_type:complete